MAFWIEDPDKPDERHNVDAADWCRAVRGPEGDISWVDLWWSGTYRSFSGFLARQIWERTGGNLMRASDEPAEKTATPAAGGEGQPR